jgi:hypothetical protein
MSLTMVCLPIFFLQPPNDHRSTQMMPSSRSIPAALRPPLNTPLTPTFPTNLTPFTSSLSTSYEDASSDNDDDDEITDPHTLSSYGLLTPSESYLPPPSPSATSSISPLLSSPKRYPHGCLRLRPPIRRPSLPKRTSGGTFEGYGYGGYGGWSCPKVVIGGGDSAPPSPKPMTPTSRTKPSYPGYLRSPSTPSSPTSSRPSPSLNSPAPLPILLRPLPITNSTSLSPPHPLPTSLCSTTSDLTSDSETEVEPEVEGGDTSSSDTCASDSDSEDGERRDYSGFRRVRTSMLKSNPKMNGKSTKRPPIPKWDSTEVV